MTTGSTCRSLTRSTIRYETGLEHILLLCTTPIDDVTSYFTFVVWRNDDFSVPADEVVAFDRAIGAEDKVMLERVPGVLPLDITATGQRAGRQALGRVAPPPDRAARARAARLSGQPWAGRAPASC